MHDDDDLSLSHSPSGKGKSRTLTVIEGIPPQKHTIKIEISRLIQLSTMSCVMEVDILAVFDSIEHVKHSILKLYDWRYTT